MVTQQGVIHVFPNRPDVEQTTTFLDIEDKVVYADQKNEEGLLGLAFHPKYAENGSFVVAYTASEPRRLVISRFRVSDDDANVADPTSEEIILEIERDYPELRFEQLRTSGDVSGKALRVAQQPAASKVERRSSTQCTVRR